MGTVQHEQQKHNTPLTSNYCPNQAMIDEFQTIFFACKLQQIKLCEKGLRDLIVDDGTRFLMLHVTVRSMTNEILTMCKGGFMMTFDNGGPFETEDNFGIRNQPSDEYILGPQEKINGCLVFIIFSSAKKIMPSYTKYSDDEGEGKTYRLKYKIG